MKKLANSSISVLIAAAFLLLTTGCTVRYVAEYDAEIKKEIVQIAKKVDLFWGILMDTPVSKRKYDKFKGKYNEIETDIRGLVMKNRIRAFNKASTKQTTIALELWVDDRVMHKKNDGFTDFLARRHRKQFERVFTAMARGEEAKEDKPTAKSSDSGKTQ